MPWKGTLCMTASLCRHSLHLSQAESAWWLQLPPLEESRRRGFHNAGSHQPTSLRQPSPSQLSDRWTTRKPLFCGGLVMMQPPCWGCDLRSDQAPVDEGRGEDVRRTNTWPAANASASWLVMTSWTGVSFLRESNPVYLWFGRVNYLRPKWTQG